MPNKEKVWDALKKVIDPELKKDLVSLEMVKEVNIEGDQVTVLVALTTPGCPLKEKIKGDIEREILAHDSDIKKVNITFRGMSDAEKEELGKKLGHKQWVDPFLGTGTRVIAVGSGKGGVGKSTVTVNLAYALQGLGYQTGILDADVYGYSIPGLMGLAGVRPVIKDRTIMPLEREGVKMISVGSFIEGNQPVAWRGPMLTGLLEQFLRDVRWGKLDYLLLDLPPGTGDVALTLIQRLPYAYLAIVTTPQQTAYQVSVRLGLLAAEAGLKPIGVINNMAYFTCNKCGERHYLYGNGEEAVAKMAAELQAPVLGHIPFEPEVRHGSDVGQPPVLVKSGKADVFFDIARTMTEKIDQDYNIIRISH